VDFALALDSPSAMTTACAAGIGTACPGSEYGMGGCACCGARACGAGAGASAGSGSACCGARACGAGAGASAGSGSACCGARACGAGAGASAGSGSACCGARACGAGAGASAGPGCDSSADPLMTSKLGCVVISETPSMNSNADRSPHPPGGAHGQWPVDGSREAPAARDRTVAAVAGKSELT
jgi:hypothetical protein